MGLVDTSAWVEFLRRKGEARVKEAVARLPGAIWIRPPRGHAGTFGLRGVLAASYSVQKVCESPSTLMQTS